MASDPDQPWLLENGTLKGLTKETGRTGRTAHNMSSSSLRKKSDRTLFSKVPCALLRQLLANLQEVLLGTKLSVLFPAIPLAIAAQCFGFARDASRSWGLSVSFLSLILVPILGNAAEHAGSIIFALKNKLDISLAVSLGSATQIAMFVVPCCAVVGWIMGVNMDLNFNLIETVSFSLAVITAAFALQDGTSHYVKGLVLILCYIVIGICFFVYETPLDL